MVHQDTITTGIILISSGNYLDLDMVHLDTMHHRYYPYILWKLPGPGYGSSGHHAPQVLSLYPLETTWIWIWFIRTPCTTGIILISSGNYLDLDMVHQDTIHHRYYPYILWKLPGSSYGSSGHHAPQVLSLYPLETTWIWIWFIRTPCTTGIILISSGNYLDLDMVH